MKFDFSVNMSFQQLFFLLKTKLDLNDEVLAFCCGNIL